MPSWKHVYWCFQTFWRAFILYLEVNWFKCVICLMQCRSVAHTDWEDCNLCCMLSTDSWVREGLLRALNKSLRLGGSLIHSFLFTQGSAFFSFWRGRCLPCSVCLWAIQYATVVFNMYLKVHDVLCISIDSWQKERNKEKPYTFIQYIWCDVRKNYK